MCGSEASMKCLFRAAAFAALSRQCRPASHSHSRPATTQSRLPTAVVAELASFALVAVVVRRVASVVPQIFANLD